MANKVKTLTPREIGQAISVSNIATREFAVAAAKEYSSVYNLRNRDTRLIADKFEILFQYMAYRNSLYGEANRIDGFRDILIDTDGVSRTLDDIDAMMPASFAKIAFPACITITGESAYDTFQINLLNRKPAVEYTCDYLAISEAATWLHRNLKDGKFELGMSAPFTQKVSDVIVKYGTQCGPNTDKASVPVTLKYNFHEEGYFTSVTAVYCYKLFQALFN